LEYLDNYYDCFLYILEKNYQIRNEEDFMLAYHIFEKYPKQLQKAVKFNDTFILLKNKSIFERITNINKLISSNYNFYNFFSFIIKNTPKLLQCNHVTKFLIENNYYDVLLQNKTKKTNKNKEMNEEKEEYELL
ncbi:MAG: hypothetical protein N2485_08525, partial [bacterium]|nr:hypothetical protein [bacterium]